MIKMKNCNVVMVCLVISLLLFISGCGVSGVKKDFKVEDCIGIAKIYETTIIGNGARNPFNGEIKTPKEVMRDHCMKYCSYYDPESESECVSRTTTDQRQVALIPANYVDMGLISQAFDCTCGWFGPSSRTSNSYFFLRNKSDLAQISIDGITVDKNAFYNGIVYAVEPHGYQFNSEVKFHYYYNGEPWQNNDDLIMIKLDPETISSINCTKTDVKDPVYEYIGPNGGSIALDDFIVEIPSGALNIDQEFIIRKLNFECENLLTAEVNIPCTNASDCQSGYCDTFNNICTNGSVYFNFTSLIDDLSNPAKYYEIVIGKLAKPADNIAAIDISGKLGLGAAIEDSYANLNQDLIVVGGPCVNTISAQLMGNPADCTAGFESGTGMIKVFNNANKTQVMVAGMDAIDTRIAAKVLINYQNYNLTTNPVITYGNSLDDVNVE